MSFIRPTDLKKSKAYPAANANASTDAIDLLDSAPGGIKLRNAEIEITLDAVPNLADTKKATLTIQDSADGVTFAAVDGFATIVQTGAGGTGAAAVTKRVKAPAHLRRYLRANVAVEAVGGDSTAKSFSIAIVY